MVVQNKKVIYLVKKNEYLFSLDEKNSRKTREEQFIKEKFKFPCQFNTKDSYNRPC